ncbi:uncharacterized protein C5orf49 homolog isoform X3 [Corapipo altera]|uniref:uncharacterized protein C5orf49 homolog isoform X3 n=1 Tax=Corapipo altera TaxID=415028 RepID=UPI000FD6A2DB|nr:uncharacterized protein C5orf49 homolog isoform X3 [Corapipo altera]
MHISALTPLCGTPRVPEHRSPATTEGLFLPRRPGCRPGPGGAGPGARRSVAGRRRPPRSMAGPGPWPPGAGGSRWAEEALGIAAARRRPALAAFSAFSFIPPRREGPPELSYFNRAAKNMFSPMTPFLEYQKVTTSIFLAVTENTQKVMVSTSMRRKWQDLFLCCHLQSMGNV